jgi:poly(A) polymerase
MRRMLALPKVARTLSTMVDARILAFPASLAGWLGAYERRANKPNLSARLALLVEALGNAGLKERWRLSNDDLTTAERVLSAARLLAEFRVNEAAYRFPAALADAIDVAATLANWTEAGKSAVLQHLEGIDVPTFPITGNDLIAKGMKPGPSLGAELERLEQKWISSNFKLDRTQLLAEAGR